jgi:hypothetical protein
METNDEGLDRFLTSGYTSPKLNGLDSKTDRVPTHLIDSLEKSRKNFLSTVFPANKPIEKNFINRYQSESNFDLSNSTQRRLISEYDTPNHDESKKHHPLRSKSIPSIFIIDESQNLPSASNRMEAVINQS